MKLKLPIIESNQAHFIASDAHNLSGRSFRLREAYDEIGKEFGRDLVYMFQENAELVVEGNTIYRQPPQEVRRKNFWEYFKRTW
ncbi:hypothetical protein AB3Z07_24435 [Metabacillus halosaccharovorans]|uniref:hypothetical protein n=1 Tax=Metabacillus halosaccharovorans TaxID=930124 RepID=UPI0034CDB083